MRNDGNYGLILKHLRQHCGLSVRELAKKAANHKNAERVDRTFDGAVLKHLRVKKQLRLRDAAMAIGVSASYLSKIE